MYTDKRPERVLVCSCICAWLCGGAIIAAKANAFCVKFLLYVCVPIAELLNCSTSF